MEDKTVRHARNERLMRDLGEFKFKLNYAFASKWLMAAEFAAAVLIMAFDEGYAWSEAASDAGVRVRCAGAFVFACLIMIKLVLSDEILTCLPTFCFMSVFLSRYYDSAETFWKFKWMAIPAVIALILHFVIYRPESRPKLGINLWGSIAVAAAVTLGGAGIIRKEEYFNPTSLYYVVFLGVLMVAAYILAKAYIRPHHRYDIFEYFAYSLYAMGLLCFVCILSYYIHGWDEFVETRRVADFQCDNNISTMLMIAMPFPCYFAAKKNHAHMIGFGLMFLGIIFSGSRGGLITGTVEAVICFILLAFADKKMWYVHAAYAVAVPLFFILMREQILAMYGIDDVGHIIAKDEARYELIFRSFADFGANPLFGRGLGYTGNADLYNPVAGAMNWYHMMIPQILGSLGIAGVLAYAFQFALRCVTVFGRFSVYKTALAVSYLGLLLMSQVNPGEFCPVPYAFLGMLLFVMAEKRDEARKVVKKTDADSYLLSEGGSYVIIGKNDPE